MEYEKAFKVIFWILSGIMFVVAVGILMFLQSIYHTVYAKINGKTLIELEEEIAEETQEEQSESTEKPFNPFSEREMEVVFYTIKGYSAVEVADKIKISKRTVERHKENMKEMIDSKNFTGVTYYVLSNQLFSNEDLKSSEMPKKSEN